MVWLGRYHVAIRAFLSCLGFSGMAVGWAWIEGMKGVEGWEKVWGSRDRDMGMG